MFEHDHRTANVVSLSNALQIYKIANVIICYKIFVVPVLKIWLWLQQFSFLLHHIVTPSRAKASALLHTVRLI